MKRFNKFAFLIVIHNAAYIILLKQFIESSGLPINIKAYAGLSLGIKAATVNAGVLSIEDFIKFAQIFWKHLLIENERMEKRWVIRRWAWGMWFSISKAL